MFSDLPIEDGFVGSWFKLTCWFGVAWQHRKCLLPVDDRIAENLK